MAHAYYNEFDPYAAAWLRNLIDAGHIAPGVVDTRDVRDVRPSDLDGFTQCHFFAGVGVWSYALRLAGVSDDEPVWTASCPCQPFSAAGAGTGISDERHLWPAIDWLIEQCRPPTILGEQVASKDGLNWFDIVSSDMEAADYAIGAVDTCAAGFGAPHIRQRLYFAAHDLRPTSVGLDHPASTRRDGTRQGSETTPWNEAWMRRSERGRGDGFLADTTSSGCNPGPRLSKSSTGRRWREPANRSDLDRVGDTITTRLQGQRGDDTSPQGRNDSPRSHSHAGASGRMADTNGSNSGPEWEQRGGEHRQQQADGFCDQRMANADGQPQRGGLGEEIRAQSPGESNSRQWERDGPQPIRDSGNVRPGPTNGPWGNADWLFCRDGKWRPVEPGTFPLAHGAASRMGRLRAYGNAINAEQAAGFISAYMERDMVDLSEAPAGDLFEWGT